MISPPHTPNLGFLASFVSIVVVNLTLSGDNAVVIAAAVKALPAALRKKALMAGAAGSVFTLVLATIFAERLLHVEFLQIAGGAAILWIAVGLFREEPPLEASALHALGFWKAMWFVVVADVTMSTDNILAVAAIARGSTLLLLIGLGISIPLVIFASGLLATMMDRFPVIVYIGAALLGRVAGDMFMTDAFTKKKLMPADALNWSVQAICTIAVLGVGFWLKRRRRVRSAQP